MFWKSLNWALNCWRASTRGRQRQKEEKEEKANSEAGKVGNVRDERASHLVDGDEPDSREGGIFIVRAADDTRPVATHGGIIGVPARRESSPGR